MHELLPLLAALVPMLILAGIICLSIRRREQIFKVPLTTRLLRPPGESLRVQIDDLDDELMAKPVGLALGCGVIAIGTLALNEHLVLGIVLIAIGSLVFAIVTHSILKLGNKIRDHRLGFLGERAIGEELNQLLASGWKVFHDVEFHDNPGQKPFNVDHVVVGTGGIFAIETKTRRKRVKRKKDDPKNEVIFNGSTLAYPWGEERFGIDQARQRSAYFANWLMIQLGTEIHVQPVLALPGWMVIRRGKSDLHVISGREIATLFRDQHKKPLVTPETAKRITALLDQKCRDVE